MCQFKLLATYFLTGVFIQLRFLYCQPLKSSILMVAFQRSYWQDFFSAETFVGTMLLFLRLQQLQLPLLGGAKLRTHHGHSHPLFSSRMGPFTRAQRYLSILNWAMDGCDIFYKYKYSQQTHDAILCITAQGIVWSDAYVIDTQGRLKLR